MPKFRRSNQKISRWWTNNVFFLFLVCYMSRFLPICIFDHWVNIAIWKTKPKKHTTSEYVWQFHPFFLIRRTSNSAMFLFLSIQAKRDRTHFLLLLLLLRVFYFLFINYTVYRSRIVQLFAYMCRSERARVLLFRMHNVMYDICVHIFIVILCCGVRHQLATVQRRMIRHICKF